MRRIVQFKVPSDDKWTLRTLPNASRVLSVCLGEGAVHVFFDVEDECPPKQRRFRVFFNGQELPLWAAHVGSAQGLHLFEDERTAQQRQQDGEA